MSLEQDQQNALGIPFAHSFPTVDELQKAYESVQSIQDENRSYVDSAPSLPPPSRQEATEYTIVFEQLARLVMQMENKLPLLACLLDDKTLREVVVTAMMVQKQGVLRAFVPQEYILPLAEVHRYFYRLQVVMNWLLLQTFRPTPAADSDHIIGNDTKIGVLTGKKLWRLNSEHDEHFK
ncbi:hypothetical protein AcV7_003116 [Taiwanofungus camphoratus]|nr:hypothetical protein AcW2_005222 [Antrodia cinnamomea]KAI0940851.1 hypothetical protein AcV7_003116 [Antrodia cinnamomea]